MQSQARSSGIRPATSYPEIVGAVLKHLRTVHGLGQGEMAQAVGVGQSTWSRIENGTIPITVEQMAFAARRLGVTPAQILGHADLAAQQFNAQGVEVTPQRAGPTGMEQGLAFLKGAAILALLAALLSGS